MNMGLDIYVFKTKNKKNDVIETHRAYKMRNAAKYDRCINNYLNKLDAVSNTSNELYQRIFNRFKDTLEKEFFSNNSYPLQKLNSSMSVKEIKAWSKLYIPSPQPKLYYRKNYLVYENFSTDLDNVYHCGNFITKDMVRKFIETYGKITENEHSFECSKVSLEYEYKYTKKVVNDFKRLLRYWKDDEIVYIMFF